MPVVLSVQQDFVYDTGRAVLLRSGRVAIVAGVLEQREQSIEGVGMTIPSASAFDPQAFDGTAEYYAIGRPPYSAQLADTIARELSLDGTGQLLDVGCGPGVLVLALAHLFDQVTALIPSPACCRRADGVVNRRESPTCTGCRASRKTSRR